MPKMTHPDSKQTIDVPADRVPMYATQGWVEKPAASDSKPKK